MTPEGLFCRLVRMKLLENNVVNVFLGSLNRIIFKCWLAIQHTIAKWTYFALN